MTRINFDQFSLECNLAYALFSPSFCPPPQIKLFSSLSLSRHSSVEPSENPMNPKRPRPAYTKVRERNWWFTSMLRKRCPYGVIGKGEINSGSIKSCSSSKKSFMWTALFGCNELQIMRSDNKNKSLGFIFSLSWDAFNKVSSDG